MKLNVGMMAQRYQQLGLTHVRISFMISGAVIVTVGLVVDRLGIGQPGSFSSGQLLFVIAGFLLLLIGGLGKRIIPLAAKVFDEERAQIWIDEWVT